MSLSRRMWSVASDAVQMSSKIKTDVFTEFGNTGGRDSISGLSESPFHTMGASARSDWAEK